MFFYRLFPFRPQIPPCTQTSQAFSAVWWYPRSGCSKPHSNISSKVMHCSNEDYLCNKMAKIASWELWQKWPWVDDGGLTNDLILNPCSCPELTIDSEPPEKILNVAGPQQFLEPVRVTPRQEMLQIQPVSRPCSDERGNLQPLHIVWPHRW